MKTQIIYIFFSLIFIFQLSGESIFAIPLSDREVINQLFSVLIKQDQLGYTLFGDKPISISGHFDITPWENVIEHVNNQEELFWKKWRTWEKHRYLFKIKNYILIKEKNKNINNTNIILINKKAFIKVVNQNKVLFETILGHKISPHKILYNIENLHYSLIDTIKNNQCLLGILLGYGKRNAVLYNQRERDYFNCSALSDVALKNSSINLEALGDYRYSPITMGSIHFSCDMHNPETKFLERKYRKLRGDISIIYSQGDFLEITLSKLTED